MKSRVERLRKVSKNGSGDIFSLAGIFAEDAKKITKGMTRKQILEAEEKAVEEGWTSRFRRFTEEGDKI
ncbi:MAG: hypothetical protein UX01_C0004G0096 [Candidatus Collierbacteria bacterium GW2011_GWB2_45_17]|uniref:Uncharacterized protein n=2 Tax=Candidatus Collieribacteriota TaxID=1752725 RepID=A0A0G1NKN0_9BACT|nr:MAG: hypothetical protein UW48_C0002G0007 [Microgenomates group bacterium GW2011_GWC1_44_23]KKT84749.1 MAG: hypothetical protein UW84_C0050G0007 [Candidatus Collierbacteria bacterium GW2011_GWA2_44_99]KKT95571.1 MAG: hypothetical protein UW96_C0006G0002 [Candidatus Collierbacteria bacterium GW2011_GWA1_45_15]KKU00529.1 MAG: hypothetical protein UX01_C0004G0096 [Candidatus Collierbacteria bacterium GW2011_GWB2_45_17]HBC44827.1 hypothetical protein [Candidatus Collierbacteria bacterium]